MAKLLVVDDETDIRLLIRRYAQREGYEVTEAGDGLEAVRLCRENDFDVVIMDIMMADMDGFTASKEIHKTKDTPILMLSARGTEYDKLFGFEVGIDDYVVKPFSPKELMARIHVIVSRHRPDGRDKKQLAFDGLVIDTLGRSVFADGSRIDLTAKEFDLLLYLAENKGIVLTRDAILSAVWGYDCYGDGRTVDWQMKLLRKKLGSQRGHIHTIRGVGYKFEAAC